MSIFSRSINTCQAALKGLAGNPELIYQRGNLKAKVTGRKGETKRQVDAGDGMRTNEKISCFIIEAREIRLGGVQVLPKTDDKILEMVGNKLHTYKVYQPDQSTSHYSPSDTEGNELRIHVKLVSVT